ncbi:something about silencing protein 10-like [Rhopilema esculentum]|uniref:something about silencing protein 10-like n=1 Tax=Rhopilema esculentum TaxID=499914 RepID=UPI0031D2B38C
MGKKRKQSKNPKAEDEDSDDGFSRMPLPDPESKDYYNDEIEKHSLQKDKILLDSDAEPDDEDIYSEEGDEIMKLDDDESDEEDEEENDKDSEDLLADEDENDEEAGLPSRKAWGRKKKEFYDSDLKDATHFDNFEEEEVVAEEEEKEAMALQQRMISHLDQQDFDYLDLEEQPVGENEELVDMDMETQIVKDLHKLSKEEKIQLLMKESPELFLLLDDYQARLNDVISKYHPLLVIARTRKNIISKEGRDFIEVMNQLLLNYCVNISFYLMLIAKRENVKDHPVIEKIVEYRTLLEKIEPMAKQLEGQMMKILQQNSKVDENAVNGNNTEASQNLKSYAEEAKSMKTIITPSLVNEKSKAKKVKATKPSAENPTQDPWDYYKSVSDKLKGKKKKQQEASEDVEDEEGGESEADEDGKRGITYEMAKNKGLTRKRKKEHRNPRVKHKMKFKKAVVKRKSQVPLVRMEASNYGGEMSGINARVTKSVRIK